ncbi:MAG: carbamate kinase [Thermoanaerobaculia bacterium]
MSAQQTSLVRPLTVVAFGGNALLTSKDDGRVEEQERRAAEAAVWLVELAKQGDDLLLVHGNGPQVGQVMIQMEEGATKVPPGSLDVAVAQTQGSVGFLLSVALHNRLKDAGLERQVNTVLSLTVVDAEDEGFTEPTKPVGPFFSRYRARMLRDELGWNMIEDSGRGWRKVVASPKPVEVLGIETIRTLLAHEGIVIAGGGGGVPVVRRADGRLAGVEAVIDKDWTAAILARELKADTLAIVTDVPAIYRNYGKKSQRQVHELKVTAARKMLDQGQFPPGSMGPKVEAALSFVQDTGRPVIISDSGHLPGALAGEGGTRIIPD